MLSVYDMVYVKCKIKCFIYLTFLYFNALFTVLNMCLERHIVTLIHYFKHGKTMCIPALIFIFAYVSLFHLDSYFSLKLDGND
jgi:hypothetical protein